MNHRLECFGQININDDKCKECPAYKECLGSKVQKEQPEKYSVFMETLSQLKDMTVEMNSLSKKVVDLRENLINGIKV